MLLAEARHQSGACSLLLSQSDAGNLAGSAATNTRCSTSHLTHSKIRSSYPRGRGSVRLSVMCLKHFSQPTGRQPSVAISLVVGRNGSPYVTGGSTAELSVTDESQGPVGDPAPYRFSPVSYIRIRYLAGACLSAGASYSSVAAAASLRGSIFCSAADSRDRARTSSADDAARQGPRRTASWSMNTGSRIIEIPD